jgi:hypothetical protein
MSFMRQMGAYNREAQMAVQAERQLKDAEAACRNSPDLAKVQTNLKTVQQWLGLHELDVARFYGDNRQAPKAAEDRLRGIVTNYPSFSYLDESLYRLGVSLVEQEQPEDGAEYFTKLVRDYSKSEFAKKGKEYLEKLGRQIPEPSNENPEPERPNIIGKEGKRRRIPPAFPNKDRRQRAGSFTTFAQAVRSHQLTQAFTIPGLPFSTTNEARVLIGSSGLVTAPRMRKSVCHRLGLTSQRT